jgi:peptidoglycan/xylan/chitin deacetylase (PgdA/CDA1 family)
MGGSGNLEAWPCLVYHDVLPSTTASGGGPERFAVSIEMFERMLDAILEAGRVGCSVAEALARPATPRVAITFDDAAAGVARLAIPALVARGMTATIYAVTDWVGRDGFMTWDQLRSAVDRGMSVQSHTRSHPFLSELGRSALRDELMRSKEALDRELRQDTVELAYPGGDSPRRAFRREIEAAGYRVRVGSRWGINTDPLRAERDLRRCTARGAISVTEARRVVRGDPWLAASRVPVETVLRSIRATAGPSRYARWRRWALDRIQASA